MQNFWVFPEILCRDKTKRRGPGRVAHKYDHWAMVQDRLNGMTWAEIEKKHGIPCVDGVAGRHALSMLTNAAVGKRLSPSEVRRVWPRMNIA